MAERCGINPDYSDVTVVELSPDPLLADYKEAMALAEEIAEEKLEQYMLLSWYDRDRDFESPPALHRVSSGLGHTRLCRLRPEPWLHPQGRSL